MYDAKDNQRGDHFVTDVALDSSKLLNHRREVTFLPDFIKDIQSSVLLSSTDNITDDLVEAYHSEFQTW